MTSPSEKPELREVCPFCGVHVVETGRGHAVHHRAGCFMGAKGSTYFLPHELTAWNTRPHKQRELTEDEAVEIMKPFLFDDWSLIRARDAYRALKAAREGL